ncbi:SET domain-containing protein 5 [Chaetomidium leptoderma]|uniref:SET domain-containing protein 5 n=1 Tax=Chaetomidium leptoderma TaxID=669021 RepID=A0AAN6ZYW7_9PEZI|nr:SET domain-containing protein 5 [Chaetomidium leptoderma]
MASFLYSGALVALCVVQFVAPVGATHGSPQQAEDNTFEQPLPKTGCLPGPLKLESHPSCVSTMGNNDASWAPWTHRPHCLDNFCVFTNADFQGPDRGVSVIDMQRPNTSNVTLAVASIAELLSAAPLAPEAIDGKKSPPYELRDIPGKGIGVVATRKISRGQVLMIDYAAVVADAQFPSRVKRKQGSQLLRQAVERLPAADEILNLARSSPDPDTVSVAEDVMKTNSFTVEIAGKDYMALFPRIARMNHACKPSTLTRFNSTTLSNIVYAFHDIQPEEELTISYSPFGLASAARHTTLSKWGFTCTCSLCASSPAVLAASDVRRDRISALSKKVVELVQRGGEGNFKAAVELYAQAVADVKEEGLVPHLGGHYGVLGQLWGAAGDGLKAGEWIKRGREEGERFDRAGAAA